VTAGPQWQFDNFAGQKPLFAEKGVARWQKFIDYVNGKAKLFQD
jgi:hypothetical protein